VRVGNLKTALAEAVLDGRLRPDDKDGAFALLDELVREGM
jgi:hypothetical protein